MVQQRAIQTLDHALGVWQHYKSPFLLWSRRVEWSWLGTRTKKAPKWTTWTWWKPLKHPLSDEPCFLPVVELNGIVSGSKVTPKSWWTWNPPIKHFLSTFSPISIPPTHVLSGTFLHPLEPLYVWFGSSELHTQQQQTRVRQQHNHRIDVRNWSYCRCSTKSTT